ncbi:MAG: hypothetical protein H7325_11645 [Pedobacter sp.]|uniref:hypothetical protein n=1 Tax=Pedobacter suwonensis TaxID=332999 RepID=UPI0019BECC32|nr:hypothetical protein [Pedobacter sp.]
MKRLTTIFFLLVVCLSCKKELVDKVVLPAPTNIAPLVVEGGVNTLSAAQYIYLTKPSYNLQNPISPINDAKVYINGTMLKISNVPGVYSGILPDNKLYGTTYHLQVLYNGSTYDALDTLQKVNAFSNAALNLKSINDEGKLILSIPKHVFDGISGMQLFYQLPGGKDWNPSLFSETQPFCYIHNYAPPYGLSPVLEQRTDFALLSTDKIDIYQFSLSKSYEQYLYNVFQETDWKSLFSANPGVVKGNVSGGALGYFYCTDVSAESTTVAELIK